MIPEKLKDLTPYILAYLKDERVQIKIINNWVDVKSISDFSSFNNEFRVYKEPELVPFTFDDNHLFRDKWVKVKGCFPLTKITSFTYKGIDFYNDLLGVVTWDEMLKNYEFEDGSPCGKYAD